MEGPDKRRHRYVQHGQWQLYHTTEKQGGKAVKFLLLIPSMFESGPLHIGSVLIQPLLADRCEKGREHQSHDADI